MKKREFYSKSRYLWAFLIGTMIFILGFYITFLVSQSELSEIGKTQTKLSYGLFEQKLVGSFFSQNICDEEVYKNINEYRSVQIGAIDSLEKRYGVENSLVLEKKKFYTLIQIAHLEFLERRQRECKDETDILFYFYSNKPDDFEESYRVGRLLDVFGSEKENLQIYSFDFHLNSELIHLMKEKYNITEYPLIINPYGKRIKSPQNILEIEGLL
jgi:hypothetical protein